MLFKLLFNCMITFIIINISNPLEVHADNENANNNLLKRFCIATLKSKIDIRNIKDFDEISNFTCKCFMRKFNSGSSIKNSRIYCRNKAAEKYNLQTN